MRLRNQVVIATEKLGKDENLSTAPIPTMSKGKDELHKLADKVIDVVDRANKKICLTLLRYSMDKPERSYAQVQLLARKLKDEKFQQIVYVSYTFVEFIYLLDVMNCAYEINFANKPSCNVL